MNHKGITVITANGDYTVPGGTSFGSQIGPDGSVIVAVHDGPFKELTPDERGVPIMSATGHVLAQFDEVEAVYYTDLVTHNS